jgi:hypothetical protein
MSNHVKRLYAAVSVLTGHGDIKQRLIKAYEENLAVIEDDDLPIALKQAFADCRHKMSQVAPLNGEGRIRASVRKMSIVEADSCAQELLDMYSDIIRIEDSAQESLPLNIAEQVAIPPFLVKSNSH